jgi:hypothetical protein
MQNGDDNKQKDDADILTHDRTRYFKGKSKRMQRVRSGQAVFAIVCMIVQVRNQKGMLEERCLTAAWFEERPRARMSRCVDVYIRKWKLCGLNAGEMQREGKDNEGASCLS